MLCYCKIPSPLIFHSLLFFASNHRHLLSLSLSLLAITSLSLSLTLLANINEGGAAQVRYNDGSDGCRRAGVNGPRSQPELRPASRPTPKKRARSGAVLNAEPLRGGLRAHHPHIRSYLYQTCSRRCAAVVAAQRSVVVLDGVSVDSEEGEGCPGGRG